MGIISIAGVVVIYFCWCRGDSEERTLEEMATAFCDMPLLPAKSIPELCDFLSFMLAFIC